MVRDRQRSLVHSCFIFPSPVFHSRLRALVPALPTPRACIFRLPAREHEPPQACFLCPVPGLLLLISACNLAVRCCAEAWFQVELPEGIQISPRHYTLRHGHMSGARLRNWVLLTSMDGDHWVVASHHKNDDSLKGPYAVHTWEIPTHIEGARMFRVVMTGANEIGGKQLVCSGFDVYGIIGSELNEGILSPSHWLFKRDDQRD